VSAPHDEEHRKLPRIIQNTAAIFTKLSLSKIRVQGTTTWLQGKGAKPGAVSSIAQNN